MMRIKGLEAGTVGKNRHSRRYLLPNLLPNPFTLNQWAIGLAVGDQPKHSCPPGNQTKSTIPGAPMHHGMSTIVNERRVRQVEEHPGQDCEMLRRLRGLIVAVSPKPRSNERVGCS